MFLSHSYQKNTFIYQLLKIFFIKDLTNKWVNLPLRSHLSLATCIQTVISFYGGIYYFIPQRRTLHWVCASSVAMGVKTIENDKDTFFMQTLNSSWLSDKRSVLNLQEHHWARIYSVHSNGTNYFLSFPCCGSVKPLCSSCHFTLQGGTPNTQSKLLSLSLFFFYLDSGI